MEIGDLTIQIQRDGKPSTLVVQKHPLGMGVNTPITLEELERLARHLTVEAARWRDEPTPASAQTKADS